MAKALMQLLVLLLCSFTVFGEELETTSPHYPVASPPYYHHPHPPTPAPAHPPTHHHHHHHHPPAPAPVHPPTPVPVKPPTHNYPPTPAPVKPPTHHYPPTPAPVKPPTHHYPPTPAPVKPPTHHHHYPPTPAPVKPPTHHHHYPPTPAPVKPPTRPYPPTPAPVKPPTHPYPPSPAPVKPPVHPFPRSFVAVQGVVYCKSCKYAGVDTLLGATPTLGATVKLQCNNTRYPLERTTKTDKNGYFFLEAPKTITTFGAHKCKVFLITSISATCQKPSNLHGGIVGATLKPEKPFVSEKLPFVLYTVGPLAFEPKCPHY